MIQHYVNYNYYLEIYRLVKEDQRNKKNENSVLRNYKTFTYNNNINRENKAFFNTLIVPNDGNVIPVINNSKFFNSERKFENEKDKKIKVESYKQTDIIKETDSKKMIKNNSYNEQSFAKQNNNEENLKNINLEDEESDKPTSYFSYIFSILFCCNKNNDSQKIDYARRVLSFNNLIKLSLEENEK